MRQAATLAHLRNENRPGEEEAHLLCGGLVLAIPAPPRHQRTDLSVWISSLHAANPFYCHTALLNIHESKLEDSHLTSTHGVLPLGRSDQWECLLILDCLAPNGWCQPVSELQYAIFIRFMAKCTL